MNFVGEMRAGSDLRRQHYLSPVRLGNSYVYWQAWFYPINDSLRQSIELGSIMDRKGANTNAQSGQYGSSLQAASLQGYGDVVQQLVEKIVDIASKGFLFLNVLGYKILCGPSPGMRCAS